MDRTIICTAPSKTFNLPGLKTANAIIPNPELRAAISATMLRNGVFGVSVFGLLAHRAAYAAGEPWLDALLPILKTIIAYGAVFRRAVAVSACHKAGSDVSGLARFPRLGPGCRFIERPVVA